jgi:hypothetical protein
MIFTLYGIPCHWQDGFARFTFVSVKEASMTFLIAACEFPDRADQAAGMWQRLAAELDKSPVDLLVLPRTRRRRQFLDQPHFRRSGLVPGRRGA